MPKKSLFPKFNLHGIKCQALCVSVYDGDTITVGVDFREVCKKIYPGNDFSHLETKLIYVNCRMAGYNSAEISRCTPQEKEIGLIAKSYLTNLLLNKEIKIHFLNKNEGELIKLKNNDPYGREIVDVHLDDVYINKQMIDSGHAAPYDGHGVKNY